MFFTYLGRELTKRKRQTALIAIGLSVAIALVMVVNSVATGIRDAQITVLSGLYGIGTDITVSKSAQPGADFGPNFKIGGAFGQTNGQIRSFASSRLEVSRGSATIATSTLDKVAALSGVSAAVATLKLNSVTFTGNIPTFVINKTTKNQFFQQGGGMPGLNGQNGQPNPQQSSNSNTTTQNGPPTGGFDGKGGSKFGITTVSVEGVSTTPTKIGPFGSSKVTAGRVFQTSDTGKKVVVLDSSYAKTAKLKLGSKVKFASTSFSVV